MTFQRSNSAGLALLIVDDHTVVREGLEVMLRPSRDIRSITTAGSAREARNACAESLPDLVLLDLRMPDEDGLSALSSLLESWPGLKIVILSGSATPAEISLARRTGARGYVSKCANRSFLLDSIRAVASGATVFPNELQHAGPAFSLTRRELDVIQQLSRGRTSHEIGLALGITEHTVKGHLKLIYQKLEATDRAEAVSRCYESGLL
jgi:DNA-binding NarL/FixJ family response regulator